MLHTNLPIYKKGYDLLTLAAVVAIDQADKFMAAYRHYGEEQQDAETKGCPTCFGSGGKKNAPCKRCAGTGRVAK